MSLTRAEIDGRAWPRREVSIDALGGSVTLRTISLAERFGYLRYVQAHGGADPATCDLPAIQAQLVALLVVDDGGRRLWADDDPALQQLPAALMDELFVACQEWAGLSPAPKA